MFFLKFLTPNNSNFSPAYSFTKNAKKKKPAQLKLAQNQMLSSTATDLKERYMISKSSLPWLSPKSLSLTDSHITIHHI